MEHVVLGLLIIQSMTLYELNRAFQQGISTFYSASYGSLQIAVRNLLNKGLVIFVEKVEKGRNKKVYSITQQGKEAFYKWMFAEVPANKLEVTALSKLFFLGLIQGAEQKRQIIREILSKIQLVEEELKQMNDELNQLEVPVEHRAVFIYQLKTLDYGIKAHSFAREWFQALLHELLTFT